MNKPTNTRARTLLGTASLFGLLLACQISGVAQSETGRVEGRLLGAADEQGLAGASVVLNELGATAITGDSGEFSFGGVQPGTYSVTLVLGENLLTVPGVRVVAGETAVLRELVEWDVGFTDTMIVRGASRRLEPIIEAPAAASLIGTAEIARRGSPGQVASLLAFTPGAQVTQGGGLWDFNIGTRGFNRALGRRVAVLLDGRDLALPFYGYQGWAAFGFPLDDLSGVELVRGPGAALFGGNASGGVINMTSKEPRYDLGGRTKVAFGQQNTVNFDASWTGALGDGWYARTSGGVRKSDGFAVSRVGGPEYSVACPVGGFGDCLPAEFVPFENEDAQIVFGSVRFDKYLDNGMALTLEGGHTQGSVGTTLLIAQRASSPNQDAKRPWARVNLRNERFDLSASYDGHYKPTGYQGLSTGTNFVNSSYRLQVDGQTLWTPQPRLQVVVGGTVAIEEMDSFDERTGRQSFLTVPIDATRQGLFGQASWDVHDRVTLVGALRGDWNTLHDFQASPRASVLFDLAQNQSLRFTYNRAFQVSNSLEFFLNTPIAPPQDLSALNGFCAPFGVDCGFGVTPILALGNEDLEVETIDNFEVGYKGVIGGRAFVTLDYYRSRSSDFVTSLLPQLGTPLGRLNPNFGPWQAPVGLPAVFADQIRALAPLLSNGPDGSNILAAASFANYGEIDSQGVDVGLSYSFPTGFRPAVTYSWFDFDARDVPPGGDDLLLGNSPTHALTVGLAYERDRVGASIDLRWVDEFRWSDGFYLGTVESYTVVDASAIYPLTDQVSVGLDITNLLDDRHWESFGATVLRRRALVSLGYEW